MGFEPTIGFDTYNGLAILRPPSHPIPNHTEKSGFLSETGSLACLHPLGYRRFPSCPVAIPVAENALANRTAAGAELGNAGGHLAEDVSELRA
jgi:hypothetical protein